MHIFSNGLIEKLFLRSNPHFSKLKYPEFALVVLFDHNSCLIIPSDGIAVVFNHEK